MTTEPMFTIFCIDKNNKPKRFGEFTESEKDIFVLIAKCKIIQILVTSKIN